MPPHHIVFAVLTPPTVAVAVGIASSQTGGDLLPAAALAGLATAALTAMRGGRDAAAPRPEPDERRSPGWEHAHSQRPPSVVVNGEIERSRRSGRSFSLVRLPGDAGALRSTGRSDEQLLVSRKRRVDGRTRLPLLAELRRIDRAWAEGSDLFLLLPETDRAGCDQLLQRLARQAPELRVRERSTIAVFPDDGLTYGGLRSRLVAPGEPTPAGSGSAPTTAPATASSEPSTRSSATGARQVLATAPFNGDRPTGAGADGPDGSTAAVPSDGATPIRGLRPTPTSGT